MRGAQRAKFAAFLAAGVLAIPAGVVVGTAGTAYAATPTCNNWKLYSNAWVPYYTGTDTVNCNMVQGTNSSGVWQLQRTLNICYGENLATDWDFGPGTKAALIRAQKKAGTTADGEYGPNTRKAIKHEPSGGGACVRVP
ncbi:peptidoglycan-binding protein [Streptomyces griseoluteus]|uniref:peptidoglycan-binding domain-containing protein n=1 Tax=Streptomyces griseoluteus TaxID=29306 RepID=UPI00367C3E6F